MKSLIQSMKKKCFKRTNFHLPLLIQVKCLFSFDFDYDHMNKPSEIPNLSFLEAYGEIL